MAPCATRPLAMEGWRSTRCCAGRRMWRKTHTGNLYITEHTGHRVRKIDSEGIITTVAGTGTAAVSGDGGPAVLADVWYPSAVDVGPDGSLYIATMNQVRRVDSSGIISTFAGSGSKNCYSYWATECGDGGLGDPRGPVQRLGRGGSSGRPRIHRTAVSGPDPGGDP